MRSGLTVVVGLSLLALSEAGPIARPAHAFDLDAHAFLARQSTGAGVNGVNFDELLRRQLGFMAGINEKFAGRTAREWIIEGARLEDSPVPRVLAHFHDPLQPFDTTAGDQAGLRFLGIQFESAVIWAQDANQGRLPYLGGKHSWLDAREAFFTALTASNDADRRNALAATFRSLGQVLHLVQDQASPAHTRNDAHPPFIDPDGFHIWADRPVGLTAILESPAAPPAPSLLDPGPPTNSLAPLRIARLIDTGRLRDMHVPEAGNDIGIAEFSSANFLSDGRIAGTIFTRPLPSPSSVDIQELTDPKTQERRLYLVKTREGATGYRLAAVSVFGNVLAASLDDAVYADYAGALFPRVIGLGSALINYFFRGRLEIAAPDRFVYALAPFTADNSEFFRTLRFKVRKIAPTNEDAGPGPGTIVAIAQYRMPLGNSNLFEDPLADLSPTRLTSVSASQSITLTDSFQEFTFDFSSQPIPTNAADLVLNVVYRGKLGLEPNAVLFGGKDIPEPDPVYIIDATDYDCFLGQPILVAGLGSGAARDLDHDGFFPDVFGPALEQGILVKIQQANTRERPTPSFFDFGF